MDTVKTYMLKVTFRMNNVIFRDIKVDGYYSLHELSLFIAKAFDYYDSNRQYMFSLNNITYDEEGYYHPYSVEGKNKNAEDTTIDDLYLKESDTFVFVYDFGQNFVFDIKVTHVGQSELPFSPICLDGLGNVHYYAEEPEDGLSFLVDLKMNPKSFRVQNDEYYIYENLLQTSVDHLNHIVSVFGSGETCNFDDPEVCKKLSCTIKLKKEELFNLIHPEAFSFLRDIYLGKTLEGNITNSLVKQIYLIGSLGLIDVSVEPGEGGDRLILYLPKDYSDFIDYLKGEEFEKELSRRFVYDKALMTILDFYGVVEEEFLISKLKSMFGIETTLSTFMKETLFPRVVDYASYLMIHNRVNYVSKHGIEDILKIFSNREKVKADSYKEFSQSEIDTALQKGVKGLLENYDALVECVANENNIELGLVADVVDEAICLRSKGVDSVEVKLFIEDKLKIQSKNFTPKIFCLFTNIMNECPMHVYKGYSFNEFCTKSN